MGKPDPEAIVHFLGDLGEDQFVQSVMGYRQVSQALTHTCRVFICQMRQLV